MRGQIVQLCPLRTQRLLLKKTLSFFQQNLLDDLLQSHDWELQEAGGYGVTLLQGPAVADWTWNVLYLSLQLSYSLIVESQTVIQKPQLYQRKMMNGPEHHLVCLLLQMV
jgi:hypothetical protein